MSERGEQKGNAMTFEMKKRMMIASPKAHAHTSQNIIDETCERLMSGAREYRREQNSSKE